MPNLAYRSLYEAPMRINGQNGIELLIEPLQEANSITVAYEVKQALAAIQKNLPPEMKAGVNYDASAFLKSSIEETFYAMAEAVLLVIFIVFLFLGSARAASIPIIIIPVSLIAVFTFIKLFGFTLKFALNKRCLFIVGLLVITGVGYVLFINLPSELIPEEDIGLIQVSVISPAGASLNYTNQYAEQVEKIIQQNLAVASVNESSVHDKR